LLPIDPGSDSDPVDSLIPSSPRSTPTRARQASFLRTSDLSRAVGFSPNTVRRYVDRGLLPPVDRTPKGYRRFTERHLDCLRVARAFYSNAYPGRAIRASGTRVVKAAVAGDWARALHLANEHLAHVRAERVRANEAAALLERWASGADAPDTGDRLRIGGAARHLGVTIDVLRNWERNGLVAIPRDPHSRYRLYGPNELARLEVVRMLGRAGYSLMSILRMLLQLDQGTATDLRHALDTPGANEDVYAASDRWLSTLRREEELALAAVDVVREIAGRRRRDT
jgi:DNA-binding transcriptional MerR regulator